VKHGDSVTSRESIFAVLVLALTISIPSLTILFLNN